MIATCLFKRRNYNNLDKNNKMISHCKCDLFNFHIKS